jgi:hypothetical protein
MTTETLQRPPSAGARPASGWDDEPLSVFRSPSSVPGSVAWNILTHGDRTAFDIYTVMNMARPENLEADDMPAFLWETIHEAARIGYLVGKIDLAGFARPDDDDELTVGHVSRAIAAMIDVNLLQTEAEGRS